MKNQNEPENFLNSKKLEADANERIKSAIKKFNLNYPIMAHLLEMPLPTFNDKIGSKTSWKLGEFARLCILLNCTSDEMLFGNALFVTEFNLYRNRDMKQQIKKFLVDKKQYKALGELTAEGFFEN